MVFHFGRMPYLPIKGEEFSKMSAQNIFFFTKKLSVGNIKLESGELYPSLKGVLKWQRN